MSASARGTGALASALMASSSSLGRFAATSFAPMGGEGVDVVHGSSGKVIKSQLQKDRSLKRQASFRVADSDQLLSPGEWVCLCRELALIGDDLSMEEDDL